MDCLGEVGRAETRLGAFPSHSTHTPSRLGVEPTESSPSQSLREGTKDHGRHGQRPQGRILGVFREQGPGGQRCIQPVQPSSPHPSASLIPLPPSVFFLSFSSLVPSPLPPHQMHSFLWPDHKEASSKDKGSPGTEQEVLTVAFSKGGRHPPTLAASTLLAPAARGGTGAKTP